MVPPILYRYRSLSEEAFKFAQDIFLRGRIFLAPATAMNDLGEGMCALELPTHMQKANRTLAEFWVHGNYGWGMHIRQHQSLDRVRLISFSESCTNQLLWAHYADSHRGICIGFATAATPELRSARAVTYTSTLPVWRGDDKDIAPVIYGTKSTDWAYEREWRIAAEDTPFLPIPHGAIQTVILGARISDTDRAWVEDWIRLGGWNVSIERAVFANDRYEMRVEPA